MTSELTPSAKKIQEALSVMGVAFDIVELPDSTRTAVDAAKAIGCSVAQIAKSIVFRTAIGKKPLLVIAGGDHRINEKNLAEIIGEAVEKADADFVREKTGFSIGGVPPIGHAVPMPVIMDETLLNFPEIWAAAGNPHAIFKITGADLKKISNAEVKAVV
jgi:prolyl-tRNA editing enzyme YbaK/EbsC (Cys-tRNA(Pro) deacylase)